MEMRQKPVTTTAETNGRKKLPGRVVLFAFVAFAVIFLDFESDSLANYGARRDSTTGFDSHQVAVTSPGTTSKSHAEDDLGIIQSHQLQQQWLVYMRRMNDTQMTGPETIIVDPEPLQPYADGNHSRKSAIFVTDLDSTQSLDLANVSIEEIVAIDESNFTKAEQLNFGARFSSVNDTVSPDNSTTISLEELITVETSSQCFPYNSNQWLHGSRWSNADSNLTEDFVYKQIKIPNPLDPAWLMHHSSQTICHAESRFRNPFSTVVWDVTNEKLIDEWEFRLLYMAIHHHQHSPAILEANARQACHNEELQVSKMDYECPSSQFLVSNVVPSGLGISIRKGAVNTILMAIATNRISMFVNNFSGGASFFKTHSHSESCYRGDIQCFFLPSTPCTVLVDDLKNATILPKEGVRNILRQGKIRMPKYADARILAMESILDPLNHPSMHEMVQRRLHTIALQLIDGIRKSTQPEQILVLETAAARIKMDNSFDVRNTNNTTSTYDNRYSKTAHAALMYLMRPNAKYQQMSDEIVSHAIPKDFDQSLSIGLSIFGVSDDCIADGRCHGFDTYMTLVRHLWDDQGMGSLSSEKKGELLLSADDTVIANASHMYEYDESFPFRFTFNDNVTLQDPHYINSYGDEDVGLLPTLTSIVSMKMLLRSKILIGNCCSSAADEDRGRQWRRRFIHDDHLALLDLFHEGCGAVPNGQIICLQDYPDPQFHLQCPSKDGDLNKTRVR